MKIQQCGQTRALALAIECITVLPKVRHDRKSQCPLLDSVRALAASVGRRYSHVSNPYADEDVKN